MKLPPPGFKQPIPDPTDRDDKMAWYYAGGFAVRWFPPYDRPINAPIDDRDIIEVTVE